MKINNKRILFLSLTFSFFTIFTGCSDKQDDKQQQKSIDKSLNQSIQSTSI
jgi:ABC-type phosphate/phosphonate transport system substrate-binding protein